MNFLGQILYIFIYKERPKPATPVRTFIVTNSRKIRIGACWTTQMKDILISYKMKLKLNSQFFGCLWGAYLLKLKPWVSSFLFYHIRGLCI